MGTTAPTPEAANLIMQGLVDQRQDWLLECLALAPDRAYDKSLPFLGASC